MAKAKKDKSEKLHITVIEGDGIGHEVVPEGIRVLEHVGRKFDIEFKWDSHDWNCERFKKKGAMMPSDGLDRIRDSDAIYLGAVGFPGVPDHVSLWGLLIPIRRGFQQYINLRPVRLFEGVKSPLADRKPGDIDYWIVRENNEGEYSSIGGRMFEGTDQEAAIQQAVFSKKGCERVMRYAFELAMKRKRREVTSATKSNGISISMPYWDERFADVAASYPKVKTNQFHIDILTAHLVRNPDWFDVIVGSNLFGDILSDQASMCVGSIGLLASAALAEGTKGLYEPIHGSAPDIAGKGLANPMAQILSVAMMLRHSFAREAEAARIEAAVARALADGIRGHDLGGSHGTAEIGQAVLARL